MTCLEQMEYTNWIAYFVTTQDNIDGIEDLINARASMLQSKYVYIKDAPIMNYTLYEAGYNTTDWAILRCPRESKWLLVTNGDNEYSPNTFSYFGQSKDGISFNFFSRFYKNDRDYERPKEFPKVESRIIPNNEDTCKDKFTACMYNLMKPYYHDLGAVIWNLERWRKENVTYSEETPSCCHDGIIAEKLTKKLWVINHIPYCFLSHSPNDWGQCKHPGP